MLLENSVPVRSDSRRNISSNPLNIRQEILRHHQPGRHCSSSTIRNLLDFYGVSFRGRHAEFPDEDRMIDADVPRRQLLNIEHAKHAYLEEAILL